ncbi:hypothetical protein C5708_08840 [Caulobacter sp. CCUG 60055]|uniref:hypothetical protein n=1 Tax=Caulobacter sp. CCUG 60055 TaxID=2100090 RepID=UPI001FA7811B|nr:hypothetical protein [Caulobacter sp. CCUG 60055]MCI3180358.1 hypothetical protein [Caulobacter sp. CCUG 60055]
MTITVFIEALGQGWAVRCPPFTNEMLFLDRGEAEEAARSLAERLRGRGRAASVAVRPDAPSINGEL